MKVCPVASVSPYALMLSPVYVLLEKNAKYVAVKAPLDFFTDDELSRLKSFGHFYLPQFVDSVMPFRNTARAIRTLLTLPTPAPYEISDAVLRMIGPLWSEGTRLEPFFVAVFANELCDLLPAGLLAGARDNDVEVFEKAVLQSSWAVFIALHLGKCDMSYLNALRSSVFSDATTNADTGATNNETAGIAALARKSITSAGQKHIEGEAITAVQELQDIQLSLAHKMSARLERVKREFVRAGTTPPTIFGQEGFVDA